MQAGNRIRLSQSEIEHAMQVALDHRAEIEELIRRYAKPHEREEVGRRINPETAVVFFVYGSVQDPYGDDPYFASGRAMDHDEDNWGRNYFAADPDEGLAVELYDLPKETQAALEERRRAVAAEGWRKLLEPLR